MDLEDPKTIKRLVIGGIVFVFTIAFLVVACKWKTVRGNELGVKETWSKGVVDDPLHSGTHFLFPGWSQTVYTYDMSTQVFLMNDDINDKNRDGDAFHVQSAEGQDLAISLNVQWRIDPAKIVHIHKTVRDKIEEKIIRPIVMRVVKDEATTRKAVDAYSGAGLVKLQADIQRDLVDPNGELAERGVMVENFVIEGIKLDDKYIGEIRARQVATQRKLRADEETKAAEAEALRTKAEAQANLNKRVVEAERDRQVGVLKAQQEAEMVTLGAQADKKKSVLAAEAEKESGILRAEAIEALGKAKAEATRLELSAYSVAGSDNFTKIKVAEAMAGGFANIKGYLPSDMKVNILSENFMKSIEQVLGGGKK